MAVLLTAVLMSGCARNTLTDSVHPGMGAERKGAALSRVAASSLAAGDLGIAMGAAGSDVAIGSARVALLNNDLRRVPFLFHLARRSQGVVRQNLLVGVALLVLGLALAGAGFLTPIWAILLHNLGSLFVVFNSARLIRLGEELQGGSAGN